MLEHVAAENQSPAPTGSIATSDLIDFVHLRRFTLDNPTLELEVLRLFVDHLPVSLALVTADATETDWAYATHTLKGAARAVGALRLMEAAEAAEKAEVSERSLHVARLAREIELVTLFVAQLDRPAEPAAQPVRPRRTASA